MLVLGIKSEKRERNFRSDFGSNGDVVLRTELSPLSPKTCHERMEDGGFFGFFLAFKFFFCKQDKKPS